MVQEKGEGEFKMPIYNKCVHGDVATDCFIEVSLATSIKHCLNDEFVVLNHKTEGFVTVFNGASEFKDIEEYKFMCILAQFEKLNTVICAADQKGVCETGRSKKNEPNLLGLKFVQDDLANDKYHIEGLYLGEYEVYYLLEQKYSAEIRSKKTKLFVIPPVVPSKASLLLATDCNDFISFNGLFQNEQLSIELAKSDNEKVKAFPYSI